MDRAQRRSLQLMTALMTAAGLAASAGAQTPAFSNQTAAAGVTTDHTELSGQGPLAMLGGGAAGDFNSDGWQDFFVLGRGEALDKLFINNGDGTFTDQAAAWGVAEAHVGGGVAVADYDDDGDLDMYVTSHGPLEGYVNGFPGLHKLYRNDGGYFTNVAAEAGVNETSPIQGDGTSATWGDYDLDGNIDLAVAGWKPVSYGNTLFRNNGDGTFTTVTDDILYNMVSVRGLAPRFADMDGDRYPELLWVADYFTSKYLINNTDGTFSEFTEGSGTGLDSNGMGSCVADFDGNGLFDWYVTSIHSDEGLNEHYGNMLYMNTGGHIYEERGQQAGVEDGGWGWAAVAVDVNHDAQVDMVETNGWSGIGYAQEQCYLYLNQGDLTFVEVALSSGLDYLGQGRGMFHFDYDNDGDEDLVILPHNDGIQLYRNDLSGDGTNWFRLFLDTRANPLIAPNGIGTRVLATVKRTTQHRMMDGGSNYLSQSELSVHFGLSTAEEIDLLRIEWSNGHITQMTAVPANQTMTVRPPGDFDGNKRTDLLDYYRFQNCYTGDGIASLTSECTCGDFDGDSDVDEPDYAELNLLVQVSKWENVAGGGIGRPNPGANGEGRDHRD